MDAFLHGLWVVIANIFAWSLIVAFVVFFIQCCIAILKISNLRDDEVPDLPGPVARALGRPLFGSTSRKRRKRRKTHDDDPLPLPPTSWTVTVHVSTVDENGEHHKPSEAAMNLALKALEKTDLMFDGATITEIKEKNTDPNPPANSN